MKKPRCVLLYSGGLDSSLAGLILSDLGVEVYPFTMETPFCNYRRLKDDRRKIVEEKLQKPVFRYKAGMDYIEVILNPKFSYGRGLNPCMDCRIFLFKKAKEYMEKIQADFIATGEVLNQRPMSQRKWQLKIIDKESGLEGMVLRPLSAKLLDETIPEKQKLVDRYKLLDISGRRRVRQIEIARKYKISDFSTSGGCLLTDSNYVDKFKNLVKFFPDFKIQDVELLRYGRHFYIDGTKIVVGRNKLENEIIKMYYDPEKHLILTPDFPGPTVLGYKSNHVEEEKLKMLMTEYLMRYSKKARTISENKISL